MKFAAIIIAAAAGVSATGSGWGESSTSTATSTSTASNIQAAHSTKSKSWDVGNSTSLAWPTGTLSHSKGPHSLTTVTVESYTTVCPEATTFTHGGHTYSATKGQTVTVEGPCTLVYPITTSSWVACEKCQTATSWPNATAPAPTWTSIASSSPAQATETNVSPESPIATAGAGKMVVLSGASLAGLVGLAAFVL